MNLSEITYIMRSGCLTIQEQSVKYPVLMHSSSSH